MILPGPAIGKETGHFVKAGIQQEALFRKQFLAMQVRKALLQQKKKHIAITTTMIYMHNHAHINMNILYVKNIYRETRNN